MNGYDADYTRLRATMRQILQEESSLSEIVQLVGKDSLSDDQKLTLEVAKIIREDFLQQNAFTSWDFTCPLDKSIGMMRCIVLFYDLAKQAIESTRSSEEPVTWYTIKTKLGSLDASSMSDDADFPPGTTMNRLKRMKFIMHQIPPKEFVGEGEERKTVPSEEYMLNLTKLADDIGKAFETLAD